MLNVEKVKDNPSVRLRLPPPLKKEAKGKGELPPREGSTGEA